MRSLRNAPSQESFDAREIPVTLPESADLGHWFRLSRVEFPTQFFPSTGSRLTPDTGKFPCAYLAGSKETTVAEVWGDRFAAHRDTGKLLYVIAADQAHKWAYVSTPPLPPLLRLCDLTDAATRLAVGIDSATLYATDLAVPQEWATRIACHPARFDGIRYRSRHTDEVCLVLWTREDAPQPLGPRLLFAPAGMFAESDAAYVLAGKIGIRLSFAG